MDEVLKAGTAPTRLEYVETIFVFHASFSLPFLIASSAWLKCFGILIAIILLDHFSCSYVMRRINQVMNDLNTLIEPRGRNGIKYEVQSQGTTGFAIQCIISWFMVSMVEMMRQSQKIRIPFEDDNSNPPSLSTFSE